MSRKIDKVWREKTGADSVSRDFKQALKEPLIKCVFVAFRIFCARNLLLKLEIRKGSLRFRAFFCREIRRKPLLPNDAVLP